MTADSEFFNVTKSFHNGLQGAPIELTAEVRAIYEETSTAATPPSSRATTTSSSSTTRSRAPCADGWVRARATAMPRPTGSGVVTSTPRRPTRRCTTTCSPSSATTTAPSTRWRTYAPAESRRPGRGGAAGDRSAGAQEHDARARRRDATSCASSASTWSGRCCCRSRASTRGRTRWASSTPTARSRRSGPTCSSRWSARWHRTTPRAGSYLEKLHDYVGGDPDVFVLSNLDNVGSVEINAFQSHAAVVMQKSTREGFGLTVSEGLWKARPVVGGAVGGIPLQIEDGVTRLPGRLERRLRASAASRSSTDPRGARAWRVAGKEHVREHFLTPRLLRDYLRIFNELLRRRRSHGGRRAPGEGPAPGRRARTGQATGRRERRASARPDRGRQPRSGLLPQRPVRRAGRHPRRRRPGDRAHRDAARHPGVWVAAARERGRGSGSPPRGELGRGRRSTATLPRALRVRRPRDLRPLLQHRRQPDAVVHPALPLGPGPAPRHPRRTSSMPGTRATCPSTGSSPRPSLDELDGDGGRPYSSCCTTTTSTRSRRWCAPARRKAFLQQFVHIPWAQSDYWRVLPREIREADLRRPARQRHRRLPHAALRRQLPAGLRRRARRGRRLRRQGRCASASARSGCAPTRCRSTPTTLERAARSARVAPRSASCCARRREYLLVRVDRLDLSKNIIRGFHRLRPLPRAASRVQGDASRSWPCCSRRARTSRSTSPTATA